MADSNFAILTRRAALGGAALLLGTAPVFAAAPAEDRLDALEKRSGARIGVAAINTGSGNAVFYRENERFLMCSTFKLMLAAAVLARVDRGNEKLSRLVRYSKADIIANAPTTARHVADGMSVARLCEAAITLSDNTAANLLLAGVGGPAGVTDFLRQLGDKSTRLDRNEPSLNVAEGDKDTTTPSAMLGDMKMVLLGTALSAASQRQLRAWMAASNTGKARLQAGLPSGWQFGDKTGTGDGAMGDLAIATPPGRKPILIVSYAMGGKISDPDREALFAEAGRIVADAFL
jgi:beta-lactamase class A